jgi:hypothetical protein
MELLQRFIHWLMETDRAVLMSKDPYFITEGRLTIWIKQFMKEEDARSTNKDPR